MSDIACTIIREYTTKAVLVGNEDNVRFLVMPSGKDGIIEKVTLGRMGLLVDSEGNMIINKKSQ